MLLTVASLTVDFFQYPLLKEDVVGMADNVLSVPVSLVGGIVAGSCSSLLRKGSLARDLVECIRQNDLDGVRSLARENKLDDPLACDELGRTALILAIDKHNNGELTCGPPGQTVES